MSMTPNGDTEPSLPDIAYRCYRHGERRIGIVDQTDTLPPCCRKMARGAQRLIRETRAIHGELFDLSCSVYVGWKSLINVVCQKHGMFRSIPKTLTAISDRTGEAPGGCFGCGAALSRARQAYKLEDFLRLARDRHGERYDYRKVVFKNWQTDVMIICHVHGPFLMRPVVHAARGGHCHDCANLHRSTSKRLDREAYIKAARAKHGERFKNFELIDDPSDFGDERSLIRIFCKPCNEEFRMAKRDFSTGRGHRKCSMGGFSDAVPALVYEIELRIEARDCLYWKIGITNGSIRERMSKDWSAVVTGRIWLFAQGRDALALEALLKECASRARVIDGQAPRLNGGGETELYLEPVVETARADASARAWSGIEGLMARAQCFEPSESDAAKEEFLDIAKMRAAPHFPRGGKLTVICGFEFPSRVAAAAALNLTGGYVSNLATAGRLHILADRIREWLDREARAANARSASRARSSGEAVAGEVLAGPDPNDLFYSSIA